jgi:hypothetical protein
LPPGTDGRSLCSIEVRTSSQGNRSALRGAFFNEVLASLRVSPICAITAFVHYAKDNFCFERVISGWRRALTVLDLRLKK